MEEIADLQARMAKLEGWVNNHERRIGDLDDTAFGREGYVCEHSYQLPPVGHRVNIRSGIPEQMVRTGIRFTHHEDSLNREIWNGIMNALPRGFTWDEVIRVLWNGVDFAKHQRALGQEIPRRK